MNLSPILSQKESWQDYFTVWYSGKINIQHATPPILMELAGLTSAQVDSLISMRVGQDGIQGTADDQKLGSIEDVASFLGAGGRHRETLLNYFDTSGDVRRIESTGYCHGVKYKIVVVSDAGAPGQIMSWEEK